MTVQPNISLTMLQAIELFRVKQPAEWTSEELAAFRARLQESPALIASLGGQGEVDRRVAEVTAALTAPAQPPPAHDVSSATFPSPARSKILWRTGEAAVFLALLVGGCLAFYFLWRQPNDSPPPAAPEKTAAKDLLPSKTAAGQRLDQGEEPASSEPPPAEITDDHTWRGWTVAAQGGTPWNVVDDWDLTDPSNPQPAKLLALEGGPVILTRRFQIAADSPLLELNVRPLHAVSQPGHIVVRVDDVTVADVAIGNGVTKWPYHVSLVKWADKEVSLQVDFAPGEPKQKVACWALGMVDKPHQEPRAESALAEGLASKDPKIRLFAAKKAGMGGDLAALPALIEALHDKELHICQAAVAALLRFDDPRAREALRDTLKNDRDAPLRIMIALGFAKRPLPEDVPALVEALKDPNPRLRQTAGRTLAGLRDDSVTTLLVQVLGDSDGKTREAAAGALALRKGQAVECALLPILTSDSEVALKLPAASYFQSNPTTRAIAPLAALLKSDDAALRRQVVQSLSASGEPEATRALALALEDADAAVRQAAGAALSRRKDAVAHAAMLAALSGNPDKAVKQQAAAHFQQFPNPLATGPLVAALGAKDESLRRQVIRALGRSSDEAAIEALGLALNDPNDSVRRAAKTALKQSKHPKAAAVLKQAPAPK